MAVHFDTDVWHEEVHRFDQGSRARQAAESARRALETERPSTGWLPCQAEGAGGTQLPGCVKSYLPLEREPSGAPYGFVFELVASADATPRLSLRLLAFGERHPRRGTRSVYERAHRRLHGRYPDQ